MEEHVALSQGKQPEVQNAEQVRQELFAFEAPYLEEHLLRDRVLRSQDEYRKAFTELKKYLWLSALTGRPLPMTSRAIDDVWHQFILFTVEYHRFCDRFFGYYMHHSPNLPRAPEPEDGSMVKEFFRLYKENFGPVPRLWVDGQTRTSEAFFGDTLALGSLASASGPR
jgi:hypothetical protein